MEKLLAGLVVPFPRDGPFGTSYRFGSSSAWALCSMAMPSSPEAPNSFTAILHALSMPMPSFLSWLTIAVELLGGLAVLFGAFIPIAAIPMVIILAVATATVHWPNGFSSIKLLPVDAAGAHFGQPATRRISSTLPASSLL